MNISDLKEKINFISQDIKNIKSLAIILNNNYGIVKLNVSSNFSMIIQKGQFYNLKGVKKEDYHLVIKKPKEKSLLFDFKDIAEIKLIYPQLNNNFK